ncbi:MAG: hypothetical protein BJ554DRAFT_6282 [Olpidium bornovanus]|uniref:Reverse transcriptase Ty1/copia-type domain-containing protein n=1 Tax=Olpidium bornovanus TaxID=278681 RepID=A0A8H8A1U5_9FUNG|nr:MAG: hypothetical protein BJ554DRAFT_6282 [Olpidium bornovanus]
MCLYGFKQSANKWNAHIDKYYKSRGFTCLSANGCVYVLWQPRREGDTPIATNPPSDAGSTTGLPACIAILYVDDITVTGANPRAIELEKAVLSQQFEGAAWSTASFFLRNRILRHPDGGISIDQQHHIEAALRRFGLANPNHVTTPLDELIGTLLYIAGCTHPDISHAMSKLLCFTVDPSTTHMACAERVLRYLKGIKNLGIIYRHATSQTVRRPYTDDDSFGIQAFVDSDWASDAEDRHSQTGYIFTLAGGAVNWRSTKQKCVALSSTEVEYLAASEYARDAVWICRMLSEINVIDAKTAIPVYIDNSGAKTLSDGSNGSSRTKHIEVRAQFVRHTVSERTIELRRVLTASNSADTLTKALARPRYEGCRCPPLATVDTAASPRRRAPSRPPSAARLPSPPPRARTALPPPRTRLCRGAPGRPAPAAALSDAARSPPRSQPPAAAALPQPPRAPAVACRSCAPATAAHPPRNHRVHQRNTVDGDAIETYDHYKRQAVVATKTALFGTDAQGDGDGDGDGDGTNLSQPEERITKEEPGFYLCPVDYLAPGRPLDRCGATPRLSSRYNITTRLPTRSITIATDQNKTVDSVTSPPRAVSPAERRNITRNKTVDSVTSPPRAVSPAKKRNKTRNNTVDRVTTLTRVVSSAGRQIRVPTITPARYKLPLEIDDFVNHEDYPDNVLWKQHAQVKTNSDGSDDNDRGHNRDRGGHHLRSTAKVPTSSSNADESLEDARAARAQRLITFEDEMEEYQDTVRNPQWILLRIDVRKLQGDAHNLYKANKTEFPDPDDPQRIRNWPALKAALRAKFFPVDYEMEQYQTLL